MIFLDVSSGISLHIMDLMDFGPERLRKQIMMKGPAVLWVAHTVNPGWATHCFIVFWVMCGVFGPDASMRPRRRS